MNKKIKVAILGATGMVGQKFIELLSFHPWFEIEILAASIKSKNKNLSEAIKDKNFLKNKNIPQNILDKKIFDVKNDAKLIAKKVDFAFCAVEMSKDEIEDLEYEYAKLECPIVSNNSAHRFTKDVPMIIPEINPKHLEVIKFQKERLNTKKGFIAVKPNCSIQSFLPALEPLRKYNLKSVVVSTYQAISGAGKVFDIFPEINDNIIPYIGGNEEGKTQIEPLKIWGNIIDKEIVLATTPIISSQCCRVPISDGHLCTVFISLDTKVSKQEIISIWNNFSDNQYKLPSSPEKFIIYKEEEDRPQVRLDRENCNGMAITIGRLREDNIFDFKFVSLSHNTIRGAAGGAILLAELLVDKQYIKST